MNQQIDRINTLTKQELKTNVKAVKSTVVVIKPEKADVLFGRGTASNEHNSHYHSLLRQYGLAYRNCKKGDKQKIAKSVVNRIKSKGGSFLVRNNAGWHVAHDALVLDKVKIALRDMGHTSHLKTTPPIRYEHLKRPYQSITASEFEKDPPPIEDAKRKKVDIILQHDAIRYEHLKRPYQSITTSEFEKESPIEDTKRKKEDTVLQHDESDANNLLFLANVLANEACQKEENGKNPSSLVTKGR